MKINRINPYTVRIQSDFDVDLFASENVMIDRSSFEEIDQFTRTIDTIDRLRPLGFFGDIDPKINRCILTPDFHRGAGIPIGTVCETHGFVLPQAVGNDIGCGMRLIATDLSIDEFHNLKDIDHILRWIFFEGGREISLSANQRESMLRNGHIGLLQEKNPSTGIWNFWDQDQQWSDADNSHNLGSWETSQIFDGLREYITGSGNEFTFDDQIGSIGGGNHFVEMQRVEEIFDPSVAYRWGLKKDSIVIMVHTGSVSIGHAVGGRFLDLAHKIYPNISKPVNGFYPLPTDGVAVEYLSSMRNAANFAILNRLFLGLMVRKGLSMAANREIDFRVVYDAPHNLIWSQDQHTHTHRKGACPAYGPDEYWTDGHPVIIPGSMGASSFVMRGHGSVSSLCSACHGAGRIKARTGSRSKIDELEKLRIITKVDHRSLRPDISEGYLSSLSEEVPSAYKDITPIIETVVDAEIAGKVARMFPLLTIKGI